ncbi:MAG: exodeoxyribonuclease VII small subunit [Bacteroidales bacterium]|nr:exodeoxyribonuclease VII small subunit [Bacteroidales bacterium]
MMQDEQLTYTSAIKELEEIVQKLQRPDCEIDQLCQLTERSVQLLAFCKDKLTKTDEQLVKLLEGLDT